LPPLASPPGISPGPLDAFPHPITIPPAPPVALPPLPPTALPPLPPFPPFPVPFCPSCPFCPCPSCPFCPCPSCPFCPCPSCPFCPCPFWDSLGQEGVVSVLSMDLPLVIVTAGVWGRLLPVGRVTAGVWIAPQATSVGRPKVTVITPSHLAAVRKVRLAPLPIARTSSVSFMVFTASPATVNSTTKSGPSNPGSSSDVVRVRAGDEVTVTYLRFAHLGLV